MSAIVLHSAFPSTTSAMECDILVVGAGPAGSSAALAAAREGARVLMVERKAKAGVPVRCAEYMPAPLLGKIGPEREFIVQAVRGMRTFLPNGEVKEMVAPGFTIRRDLFDQTLPERPRMQESEPSFQQGSWRRSGPSPVENV